MKIRMNGESDKLRTQAELAGPPQTEVHSGAGDSSGHSESEECQVSLLMLGLWVGDDTGRYPVPCINTEEGPMPGERNWSS